MAGGILDRARQRLPIQYQGHQNKVDIYGNRVAPGGISNYRMPSFGSGIMQQTPEQACMAQGGQWDPILQQCILPENDDPQALVDPQAPIDDRLRDAYVNAANYGGHGEGSIIGNVNVAAGRNPQWDGIGQNDPAFAAAGYVPIHPPEGGDYRTAGYGESGRVTGALTNNKETALAAGDWYSAVEAGATPEEIEAAGGPERSKTADIFANVITGLVGAGASKIFEAVTGTSIKDAIASGATKESILKQLESMVPEAQAAAPTTTGGGGFKPSVDNKTPAQIVAEQQAVSNAWADTAGVASGNDNDNDDWRDAHNARHEANVKAAAAKAVSEGKSPVGSYGGPSPHRNAGGILSKANGGLNHGNPQTHPGQPMGTDQVPLWGEEGEFVMTREGTAKMEQDHPGLLQKYNDYRPPEGTVEGAMSQLDDLINKYAQRGG